MKKACSESYWIGFDLGGTKMMATVYDPKLKIISRLKKKTKVHEGVNTTIERIVGALHTALDEARISVADLGGIGIGAPGALDLDEGIILNAPNLGWKKIALKNILEKEFDCTAAVLNDVDAGVFGEYSCGAAQDARSVFGIFPGTGIGGGCVYEGKLIRGKSTSCMEIGHVNVLPDGPLCGCGRRGCLESIASRLAIASAAIAAVSRGEAPNLLKIAGTDYANYRSGALAQAIKEGDASIEQIVRNAAHWLGRAVAGVVNLMAPDMVLLGGGLVEAMPDLYRQEVKNSLNEYVMPGFEGIAKIVVAELGDDAVATGAAAWVRREVIDKGK